MHVKLIILVCALHTASFSRRRLVGLCVFEFLVSNRRVIPALRSAALHRVIPSSIEYEYSLFENYSRQQLILQKY